MRKSIFYILIAMFFSCRLLAQGINFEQSTWAEVLQKAKKESKPIFVDVYTSWCGPCKAMEAQVFPRPEVGNKYNNGYINVKIDAEKGEGIDIARKYAVKAYPTYLFINPADEKLIGNSVGSVPAEKFISLADGMMEKYAGTAMPVEEMDRRFEAGNYDEKFLLKYLERRKLEKQPIREAFSAYVKRFMAGKKDWTPDRLLVLARYFETRSDTVYNIAFNNYSVIRKLLNGDDMAELEFEYDMENATRTQVYKLLKSNAPANEKEQRVKDCLSYVKNSVFSDIKKDKFRLDQLEALYRNTHDTLQWTAVKRQYIERYLLPDELNGMIGSEPIIMDKKNINYVIPPSTQPKELARISSWCSSYAIEFSKIISTEEDRRLATRLSEKACRLDSSVAGRIGKNIVSFNCGNREDAIAQMPALLAEANDAKERNMGVYQKVFEKMKQNQTVVGLY